MPTLSSFDYAVIRVVPRVDREEFLNAGVILFCLAQRYLKARVHTDTQRLNALWPHLELDVIGSHLEAFVRVSAGDAEAGQMAQLSQRERFHWLVAPRSTIIQVSPVHTGLCETPESTIEQLFQKLVATS